MVMVRFHLTDKDKNVAKTNKTSSFVLSLNCHFISILCRVQQPPPHIVGGWWWGGAAVMAERVQWAVAAYWLPELGQSTRRAVDRNSALPRCCSQPLPFSTVTVLLVSAAEAAVALSPCFVEFKVSRIDSNYYSLPSFISPWGSVSATIASFKFAEHQSSLFSII